MAESQGLKVGDLAPDFEVVSSTGQKIHLADFRGRSEVVLFFYPKDNSPACTLEACSFRDNHDAFRDAGAEVIGISGDSDRSHQGFANRFGLAYPLVSDSDGALRKLYGVPKTLGIFPGRVTYVIDRNGLIRSMISSQMEPWKHIAEALKTLKSLRDVKVAD